MHLADEDGNGTLEFDEFQKIFVVTKEFVASQARQEALTAA